MDKTALDPKGEYGFDGSLWGGLALALIGVALAALALVRMSDGRPGTAAFLFFFCAAPPLWTLAIYLHTTRRGKFQVWAELLPSLGLRGDERVLDVGCGRGAVLTMIAKLVPGGRVVGIDLWSRADQWGNGVEAARRNLAAEGVADRCELHTGDMRSMPFPDASFDLVVSSLAVHNILDRAGRLQAIDEIVRVLKPGGRVVLADLAATRAYARRLEERGLVEVRRRGLGWRFWWGPAVPATSLVTATKAAPSSAD